MWKEGTNFLKNVMRVGALGHNITPLFIEKLYGQRVRYCRYK